MGIMPKCGLCTGEFGHHYCFEFDKNSQVLIKSEKTGIKRHNYELTVPNKEIKIATCMV